MTLAHRQPFSDTDTRRWLSPPFLVQLCLPWLLLPLASATAPGNSHPSHFMCPLLSRHVEPWHEHEAGGFKNADGILQSELPMGCASGLEHLGMEGASFLQTHIRVAMFENQTGMRRHHLMRSENHTASVGARLALVPFPAVLQLGGNSSAEGGSFIFKSGTQLHVGPGISADDVAVQLLKDRVHDVTGSAPIIVDDEGAASSGVGLISVRLAPDVQQGNPEGYKLSVQSNRISLTAAAPAGLFYGVQTLRQLVPPPAGTSDVGATASKEVPWLGAEVASLWDSVHSSGLQVTGGAGSKVEVVSGASATKTAELAALTIEDSPAFGWRGLMVDVSRHFFTADQVKKLIDVMAAFKMNRLHWHLTDDQGWRLPVEGLPELIGKGAGRRYDGQQVRSSGAGVEGAYTTEEIRSVVAYAKARHIEILPEVDVPGHVAAAVAAYPELGNAGFKPPAGPQSNWGVHPWTLAPTNKSVEFLERVFATVTDLFPFEYVHVGGDEAPEDQWRHSTTEARKAWEHFEGPNPQSFFNNRVSEILRKHGRRMAGWDEVLSMSGLPSDATIFSWRSEGAISQALRRGLHVVNADSGHLYLDHYQGSKATEPKAICCFTSLKDVYNYNPVPRSLASQQRAKGLVLGAQAQLWSEYIPSWSHLEYMAFPRTMALAERLWSQPEQAQDFDEFRSRLKPRLQDLRQWGVNFRPLD